MLRRALALAFLIISLSGCIEGRREPGPVRLAFRHAKMPGANDPLPALLREFERLHPGIVVDDQPLPWSADVQRQVFVINLEGRSSSFDVLMLDVIWPPEFARAGWLLDLTDRWSAADRTTHFPATVEAATHAGRYWAVPWLMNAGLLYYRRDLLERHGLRPPRSYAELVRQAEIVRRREGDPALEGFLWQGKQYEGLVVNILESFWAAGTDLVGSDGTIFPDEGRARAALEFRRGLLTSGISPRLVAGADEELTRREFGAGRAVFLRNWPYAAHLFEAPTSPVRGRFGIVPLPGGGALGGAHLAIDRATRHPDATWALVEFLTRPDAQRAIAAAVGLYPTRPALFDSAELLEIFRSARPRPVTPWYAVISATLQPQFSAAIVGVKTPARAVADAKVELDYFTETTR